MDWLTSAPIWQGRREAPSHRWDEISRDAGVVRGAGEWAARLETYAANQDLEAEERSADDDSTFRRNARWARELREFITALHGELGNDVLATHSGHAAKALVWLDSFLPEQALGDDEAQLEAREQVRWTHRSGARSSRARWSRRWRVRSANKGSSARASSAVKFATSARWTSTP
jgi:hypothetical protein